MNLPMVADGTDDVCATRWLTEQQVIHDIAVSPDGQRVACVLAQALAPVGRQAPASIHVVDVADTQNGDTRHHFVVGDLWRCAMPTWSSDGTMLAFVDEELGALCTASIATDGRGCEPPRQLVAPDGVIEAMAWSADASELRLLVAEPGAYSASGRLVVHCATTI
jgi:dipeptidyl aminopeptidase/acylaminoacyl peptidase